MESGELTPLAFFLTKLGVMIALALIVERIMTTVGTLIDRLFVINLTRIWITPWQKRNELWLAERAKQEEDLLRFTPSDSQTATPAFREIELNPVYGMPDSRFDVKDCTLPDPVRMIKDFWMLVIGNLVSIAVCYYLKFSIPFRGIGTVLQASSVWEYVLTGIIIGASLRPVRLLFDLLIERKFGSGGKSPTGPTQAPISIRSETKTLRSTEPLHKRRNRYTLINVEDVVGFTYNGGDRPGRLEYSHTRTQPINKIIYHHTAMHSDSPFEEVAREFERKGWLAGYHAVVMKDGKIRILSRWDRIGNHVRGHNDRSVGLAFHGNFELDQSFPNSNSYGRFGILSPTYDQIHAAARLVAMWADLYKIPLDFSKNIFPHHHLEIKHCPGSNFPHRAFHECIAEYAHLWRKEEGYKRALERFTLAIPRLYA